MKNIDVHTHLLPGIDDGARSIEQTIEMLSVLKKQGIEGLILTPHFYSDKESVEDFIQSRNEAFEKVKAILDENDFEYILAAEVYLTDYLLNYDSIKPLCFGKKNYIFVEFPYYEKDDAKIIRQLNKLIINYGVTPIIVHLERYPALFNSSFIEELTSLGCLFQCDIAGLNEFGTKSKLIRFLKKGDIQFVGSDCHDTKNRKPNFDIMYKVLPENLIEQAFENNFSIFKY